MASSPSNSTQPSSRKLLRPFTVQLYTRLKLTVQLCDYLYNLITHCTTARDTRQLCNSLYNCTMTRGLLTEAERADFHARALATLQCSAVQLTSQLYNSLYDCTTHRTTVQLTVQLYDSLYRCTTHYTTVQLIVR